MDSVADRARVLARPVAASPYASAPVQGLEQIYGPRTGGVAENIYAPRSHDSTYGVAPAPHPQLRAISKAGQAASGGGGGPTGRRYSSSDEGEEGNTTSGYGSKSEQQKTNDSLSGGDSALHTSNGLGLTADESAISPLEADAPISRLYAYDPSDDERGPRAPRSRRKSESRSSSAASSRSSSCCDEATPMSPARMALEHRSNRNCDVRTLDSRTSHGTSDGENLYSHINDSGIATLPLGAFLSAGAAAGTNVAGPAVPPRPGGGYNNRVLRQGHPYTDTEPDWEPQFLIQTASGSVFVPNSVGKDPPEHTPPAPVFPRTHPRGTGTLPSRGATQHNSTDSTHNSSSVLAARAQSQTQLLSSSAGAASDVSSRPSVPLATESSLPVSNSEDRQNGSGNQQGTLPRLPTYPSTEPAFHEHNGFASYRIKKKLNMRRCLRSWKCATVSCAFIIAVLIGICAYLVAYSMQRQQCALAESPLNCPNSVQNGAAPLTPITPATATKVDFHLDKVLHLTLGPQESASTEFYVSKPQSILVNASLSSQAVFGIFGMKNRQPSFVVYDWFHRLDGRELYLKKQDRYKEGSRSKRRLQVARRTVHSVFNEQLDPGIWHLVFVNDQNQEQTLSVKGSEYVSETDCPSNCNAHGDCIQGQCHCSDGYEGWDCSKTICPVLCSANGLYVHGKCECYKGYKGAECQLSSEQCEDPTCSYNGKCVHGKCVCSPGFKGADCSQVACVPAADCSGNGACIAGQCRCYHGFHGDACSAALNVTAKVLSCTGDCDSHGTFDPVTQACRCDPGWTGSDCRSEVCTLACVHGTCFNQRCQCDAGWTGALCDAVRCDARCVRHGHCENGTCVCRAGWNGRHCSLEGCPSACNNHGACQYFQDGWRCSCRAGWKGAGCEVKMETACSNGVDDDLDGLPDCQDPDCCISTSCKESVHCMTSPDPMEILLRKQPPSSTASFYDRMKFLVEDDSVQSYATLSSFNTSQVSVIRGRVLAADGSPVIGVRVDVKTQPLYGFTLSRELGLFDMLVNGGGSVTLQFRRQPFAQQEVTVMVPWNKMVTMETVTLLMSGENRRREPSCAEILHDYQSTRPLVLSTWQHTQLGACAWTSTVIPESQVLQESLRITGTDVHLVYHSSETPGYMSTILIQLTGETIPEKLAIVHLRVSVEGLTQVRRFEADPGLKHKFAWDRRNSYNQKVYGIVIAMVSVGYEYSGCSKIFWETQSATLSGYDITSSEIGGWNLHVHHTYNFQEGILHKGDGTNIYLKERPRKVVTVLGTGKQRRLDCRKCDGKAETSRLMAPVALASGRDGALYVGDFNFIRKLSANREDITNILELKMEKLLPYVYFMTVSPLDGRLYISDYSSKKIFRVKTMGAVRDLDKNLESIAGNGLHCVPGSKDYCGDAGPAKEASLAYPKGIAINKDGVIFFADGANIRVINKQGQISTLIGHQQQPSAYKPLPCNTTTSIEEVTLLWPTALAINPLDDTLFVLDNNMVHKVTKDGRLLVVAGRPLHCPMTSDQYSSLLNEEHAGPKMANEEILISPQHISFSPHGDLFIVESDERYVNRIRMVRTDGTIVHYVGARPKCSCNEPGCKCFEPKEVLATKVLLHKPTAVTVTADSVLHVADMGNLRVLSVVATLPEPDRYGQYSVLYPQTQEAYVFNRYGQHISTRDLITNKHTYNFTYNVNSYYGKLVKIVDSGGGELQIRRDYTTAAKEITPPSGGKCKFIMNNMGQMQTFIDGDNSSTTFSYMADSGLLDSKQVSNGQTFLYTYDDHGRLAAVVNPTGERTKITTDVEAAAGAVTSLATDGTRDRVALATSGHSLSLLHEANPNPSGVRTRMQYLHDGALVVEYPHRMAVTMETAPHPLLTTENQLQVKRKIILPGHLVHRLEWRYYLRRKGGRSRKNKFDQIGRRMRVGEGLRGGARLRHADLVIPGSTPHALHNAHVQLGPGYDGKEMLINGETTLSLEYDRITRAETVLDKDEKMLLSVAYNKAGLPLAFKPQGKLKPANLTYTAGGQLKSFLHGDIKDEYVYDSKTGLLSEIKNGGIKIVRYLYKNGVNPSDVILPSGKQYVFHYDHNSNLASVIMPSLAKHKWRSLSTLGMIRLMYHAPHTHGTFIVDKDSGGKTRQITYPSGLRRSNYFYDAWAKPLRIVHDWAETKFTYQHDSTTIRSIRHSDELYGYSVQLDYNKFASTGDDLGEEGQSTGALVRDHGVIFTDSSSSGFVDAQFEYSHDKFFRVIYTEARIGSLTLKPVNVSYNIATGRPVSERSFTFLYSNAVRFMIRDINVEMVIQFDGQARRTDVWYRFNNFVVFTLEVKYDTLGRILHWRRKLGTSDTKSYDYSYTSDSDLSVVRLNGRDTWRFDVDADQNIVEINEHDAKRKLTVNKKNQLTNDGAVTYHWDRDGFNVKRDEEMFSYNSLGHLIRSFKDKHFDIRYIYHPLNGNLLVRNDVIKKHVTQFFYGDLKNPDRVTHLYDSRLKKITHFFYDYQGYVYAMERGNSFFYIGLDPLGSPLAIFNAMGSVQKSILYDPLGRKVQDSNPQFFFPIGYRGGIYDETTGFVHLKKRVYDPRTGRFTAPDYMNVLDNLKSLTKQPQLTNLYQHMDLINPGAYKKLKDVSGWLEVLGFDLESLLPDVTYDGHMRTSGMPHSDFVSKRLLPVTSAFACAFERDMRSFTRISTVPRSVVTSSCEASEPPSLQPYDGVFGRGVLLSVKDDLIMVDILEGANPVLSALASTLLNNTVALHVSLLHNSKDVHYFLKEELAQAKDDVRMLGLRGAEVTVGGLNVTLHRSHVQEQLSHVDLRIHTQHTVLNVRYGANVAQERVRLMAHAQSQAIAAAWRLERELALRGQLSIHQWTAEQRRQLLNHGKVNDVEAEYVTPIDQFPWMADSPCNIRFRSR